MIKENEKRYMLINYNSLSDNHFLRTVKESMLIGFEFSAKPKNNTDSEKISQFIFQNYDKNSPYLLDDIEMRYDSVIDTSNCKIFEIIPLNKFESGRCWFSTSIKIIKEIPKKDWGKMFTSYIFNGNQAICIDEENSTVEQRVDSDKKIIKVTNTNSSGEGKYHQIYNCNGDIIESIYFQFGDDDPILSVSFEYNESGLISGYTCYDNVSDDGVMVSEGTKRFFEYSNMENLVSDTIYFPKREEDEPLFSKKIYKYDENNLLTEISFERIRGDKVLSEKITNIEHCKKEIEIKCKEKFFGLSDEEVFHTYWKKNILFIDSKIILYDLDHELEISIN